MRPTASGRSAPRSTPTAERPAPFAAPRIQAEQRPDGRLVIRSTEPLGEHPVSVVHSFRAHADVHPDRLLVAERGPDGEWVRASWGEVRRQADRVAQGLLDRGLTGRPVMILSGNSVEQLLVMLAGSGVAAHGAAAAIARPRWGRLGWRVWLPLLLWFGWVPIPAKATLTYWHTVAY